MEELLASPASGGTVPKSGGRDESETRSADTLDLKGGAEEKGGELIGPGGAEGCCAVGKVPET